MKFILSVCGISTLSVFIFMCLCFRTTYCMHFFFFFILLLLWFYYFPFLYPQTKLYILLLLYVAVIFFKVKNANYFCLVYFSTFVAICIFSFAQELCLFWSMTSSVLLFHHIFIFSTLFFSLN